jgi:(1->4)-alpha-D-glucan 1-alpha-D-glucosylmutase
LDAQAIQKLMDSWHDGGIKLRLIEKILQVRKSLPQLFQDSSYVALSTTGPAADRICAFARQSGATYLVVAVALFPCNAGKDEEWEGTVISLPAGIECSSWLNLLESTKFSTPNNSLTATALFATLPVAVLIGGA